MEISCHGGILVTEKYCVLCFERVLFPQDPVNLQTGFLMEKLTLTQAEAVTDLINAESEKGVKGGSMRFKGCTLSKNQHGFWMNCSLLQLILRRISLS